MLKKKQSWDEEYSTPDSLQLLENLALRHAYLGGPEGAVISQYIVDHDWASLASYELSYHADWSISQLINVRQALGFFQKFGDLPLGVDKEKVAYEKFVSSEESCRITNDQFRAWQRGVIHFPSRENRILHAARRKIAKVLGRCPDIRDLQLRFGPGATTSIKRTESCPQNKMAAGFICSDNLWASPYLAPLLQSLPHWLNALESDYSMDEEGYVCQWTTVDLIPGRLEFVPKNAKTYRSIVVEPVLNGMLQAGIGDHISRLLKRVGVDIKDQSRNKNLARSGSITGELATLDLSSASDTISYQLVKFLLPGDWFSLLNASRSASVTYRGRESRLEKFSSMGNGFTFPLETLIFWALTTESVSAGGVLPIDHEQIGVYGDDIICPVHRVHNVIRTLTFCGFQINLEKSYWEGPFRESCGGDYYLGFDIRPFYQKQKVSGCTLFSLHNFYAREYDVEGTKFVRDLIPRPLRLYGPDGYGDGHLISEDWTSTLTKGMRAKGYSGRRFDTFTHGARRQLSRYPGDWVSPLYSIYTRGRDTLHPLVPVSEGSAVEFVGDRPVWPLPGRGSYKRISLYILGC